MPDLYVANTDNAWFDFLRERRPWQEVNFWKPSQQIFKAIDEGGLFVFRLKSPRNVIGGYGILSSAINVPIKFAWESLGQGNGVESLETMVRAIGRYRKRDTDAHSLIGCRVLVNPVFFDEHEWFPIPEDWSQNIVTGKVYRPLSREGGRLLEQLQSRTAPSVIFERDRRDFEGFEERQARFGAPTTVIPRLGQGAFRIKVAGTYQFSCAISETRVLPALDAAHIRPYREGGSHSITNGIMLRKDIHSVFDEGFATIDNDGRFVVSSQVKERFNNGSEYRRLHGKAIWLPASASERPSLDSLEWHQNNKFVGA
ncbi:HNH endonuclease [Amaricoccus solimangrovi]|uniref:HNH endonuclease n=1 Tax=Amaricoccus solimangrovi TaxID=2589815 RepID=A0A501WB65_9RHOB|nr:HNH endonuclease [Amaricoccus solimangrovi]TPE47173.1 HNH endonuclease [Amaricoccus solimangrovi]